MESKKGLELYKEEGAEAVLKELRQIHSKKDIIPLQPKEMTYEQKKAALRYLMFLKKKLCGRINGRDCVDGRKKRVYVSKEESSYPTVTTEGIMVSCILDAMEGRDVATVDIHGSFLNADMDDIVDMQLDGAMAKLLVKVDLKTNSKHLVLKNGKKV